VSIIATVVIIVISARGECLALQTTIFFYLLAKTFLKTRRKKSGLKNSCVCVALLCVLFF